MVAGLAKGDALSYEIQYNYFEAFPITIAALNELSKIDFSSVTREKTYRGSVFSFRHINQKESEQNIAMAKNVARPLNTDDIILGIIQSGVYPYLKSSKEQDSVIDMIVNRIELYIFEQ